MEDDDEFGDLYTDVLRPFQSSSTLHPPPSQSKQTSPNPPTDHNPHSDDEEIFFGASSSNPNPKFNFASSDQNQTLALKSEKEDFPQPSLSMVLESGGDVKSQGRSFGDLNLIGESAIDVLVEESDDKDDVLVNKDEVMMDKREDFDKFDIEEVDTGIGDAGPGPLIPGITVVSNAVDNRGDVSGEADDWDSDSEDDLQIVLNDSNHGPMTMEMGGVMGSDDEDEDGEPLVIVADSEPGHQPMEEQEWGEDAAQGMDGERKEGDAGKVNGGVVGLAPKLGYSSHVYHPYHSQFKYVRPGAAPMPGVAPAGPGGAPGQVRPPVNMGPLAGRGRGDWRPLQKSFHQGFGMPAWGNNTSVRGFGSGLDFTLPSHKTIFDIDVDSFEEKPWRIPGIDISDFFNFGLNEESWKDYCKQLEQLRLETTMQSKIRVYESGRTEQEYDPDLPPELAAAAGIHDITSENANHGKVDAGQSDGSKGSARVRPPLPTGRAIQVETGNGERLPSIDTRPPRMRDSDAIIEIVLQDSADDSPFPGNDVTEQAENDPSGADCRESREIEGDVAEKDGVRSDGFPHVYNGRKRELVGRATPFRKSVQDNPTEGDGILPSLPEAPVQYSPDSRGKSSAYPGRDVGTLHGERRTKGRPHDRSPNMACSDSAMDKRSIRDDQKEDSVESIGGKSSPHLSSPVTVGSAEELDVEQGYGLHDELVVSDESSGADREEMTLATTASGGQVNENPLPSAKKQKLSSRVEQSSLQEINDGGDFKAARSSENSKARSGSSRDYQQLRESVEKEAVQNDHSTRMRNLKRSHGDDERGVRGKGHDERHEMEKHRLVENVREDSYPRRDWDPYSAHHLHGKYEGTERRKERENSEGAWHRRDVDPHVTRARAEDAKKQERSDEIGSRHRNKARESERINKDEHLQLRKQLDNGNLRGHHDRDVESRRGERNGNLKGRYEDMDDVHRKRRKEEEHLRDAGKEEILHGHRENTSRSKRDRDEALDLRKRDDQVRVRDDDRHLVRHKEEGWIHRDRGERQREQDDLHKIKPSHEETLSKREREDGRGLLRSGRAADNKPWVSHARVKDDYKDSDRDYQFKDTRRHSEQFERRDRVENGYFSQHVGREDAHTSRNQLSNDDRRSRQERGSACSDRGVGGSDNDRTRVKKHKETTRKSKESEGGDQNSMGPSKRNQENQSSQMNEPAILKGTTERGTSKHDILLNRHSSRKHREDASSDDEQQDSKRGRSKLERWTSHKERDFSIATKSSSSLKVKAIDRDNNGVSSSTSKKLPDESPKTVETITNQHPPGDEKDAGDPEIKNVDVKSMEDRHSDTVAKLKKRSERFKLPMPSEKEATVIKKMESEPLPSAQSEARADSEIKPERPARKRRWISN